MRRILVTIVNGFNGRVLTERVWTLLLALLLCCPLMAADGQGTVDMVSYEQSAVDREATISLKNNTGETVHNVAFRLTYLDLDGTALDYSDFVVDVDIEPGLTRKVDIEAYEHERFYAYCKSDEDSYLENMFKVKYEYKGMNVKSSGVGWASGGQSSGATNDLPVILGVLASMLGGIFYVTMIVLVASMARSRNRNPIGWVALSFVLTPFVTALILRCLGKGPVQYVYVERDANGRPYYYDANGRPYFRDSDADSRRGGAPRSGERRV